MITAISESPETLPRVARLGYGDGWLLLPPTFLKFCLPVVVVDHAYVGEPSSYGLKPFAACDPEAPLPVANLVISSYGDLVMIRPGSTTEILTSSCRQHESLTMLTTYPAAVLLVGSTYELESTWAALWNMSIGRAKLITHEESNEYS